MKLAEALANRADIQRRLSQMRSRLQQSALVQEGEQPPENPLELLTESEALVTQLTDLIVRINRVNLAVSLADGTSLTEALARRDALALRHSTLSTLADAAANRLDRYSRTEIKRVATVDVAALRKQIDELAHQRRELDIAIQALNWSVDMPE